jgi:hypothetical protein
MRGWVRLRTYLAATCIFVNEVKGKSALALSRDLDCQYKTAFVLSLNAHRNGPTSAHIN